MNNKEIRPIWGKFQATKKTQTYRDKLRRGLATWAARKHISTHNFFSKVNVDDIVDVRPNPGGTLSVYEYSDLGLSPLMCLPRTTQAVERAMRLEDAGKESAKMCNKE